MITLEGSTQPPANRNEDTFQEKDYPIDEYVVVLDVGQYDVPLRPFNTRNGAEIYYLAALTLGLENPHFEIKTPETIRYLQETFVRDDILVEMTI